MGAALGGQEENLGQGRPRWRPGGSAPTLPDGWVTSPHGASTCLYVKWALWPRDASDEVVPDLGP